MKYFSLFEYQEKLHDSSTTTTLDPRSDFSVVTMLTNTNLC